MAIDWTLLIDAGHYYVDDCSLDIRDIDVTTVLIVWCCSLQCIIVNIDDLDGALLKPPLIVQYEWRDDPIVTKDRRYYRY